LPVDFAFSAMAARSDISPARWRRPFLSWLDGIEAGWAVPLLLIGFTAVWLAFLIIAYLPGDLHPDVLETWTIGRTFRWGCSKHPPLMGWVARAWTSIFPLTNWSFQLMALANSAIALWAVDLTSRRFVRGDKRIVVLLLLMLLPTYQFHAQRFNANAVLLATWPIATYCFLRSFETRQVLWAVAAGATAALAMLGKYYSVFLIGAFVFAAICHPKRRAYFGSLAPWVSTVVGLAALGPHFSRQRRDDRPSTGHLRRAWKRHATDLGTTRSFPVRHSDCLRCKLSDRTLLFGQPGGPYHWHCGASRRRSGSNSRPISKFPSIKRGT
jgi:4-amino-4-deoxy-L-arabinose transferase-like glycosyltransferase